VDLGQGEKVHNLARDRLGYVHDNEGMPKSDGPNHLKAWRKHRKLTQQQLADAIEPPTTKQVIQAIESGARGLSDKWLRRLAPALGTTPGFLLDHHPDDLPTAFLDIWADVPEERKAEAEQMLRIFTKKAG
jgi:transcriptional regulator with XRE-family HTH domain